MAFNSTPHRRFGVALGVILTGVTAGLIGFAGVASAHIPDVKAECKGETTTLNVKLTHYVANSKKKNTIKITDGDEVLHEGDFRDKFEQKFEEPGDVDHHFTVTVKAWDDPDGSRKWSFESKLDVKACVTPTETTTTTTESTTTTTESTTTTTESTTETTETTDSTTTTTESQPVVETTPTTTTTPPVVKDEDELAFTGASVGVPLGIGGVLLVGGVVLLFVIRRRGKA